MGDGVNAPNPNDGGMDMGGDEDGQMADASTVTKKDLAKILMAIANKDQRVDPWIWTKFKNPAHPSSHNFQLSHWAKEKEKDEPYQFSKFNR